jgi:hypothetical protein
MIELNFARLPERAPSPLEGEGWGGGYFTRSVLGITPLPTAFANAQAVDLPLKGGGKK